MILNSYNYYNMVNLTRGWTVQLLLFMNGQPDVYMYNAYVHIWQVMKTEHSVKQQINVQQLCLAFRPTREFKWNCTLNGYTKQL